MDQPGGVLAVELHRILAAPYLPSLKKFDEILTAANAAAICESVAGLEASQIAALLQLVREALALWPYALNVLQKLCCAIAFRDALVQREPALFETLLETAVRSEHDFQRYSPACVILLSEPLPESAALPAAALAFFLNVFDRAATSPCSESIRSGYRLLDGACSGLVELLSDETREDLLDKLYRLIKQVNIKQDQELQPLCLWSIRRLGGPGRPLDAAVSPEANSWKSDVARTFFTGPTGLKSVNLLVLCVIWACKDNVGLAHHQAVERVKLALETVQAVDPKTCQEWAFRNPQYVKKLVEKAVREDLHPELQLLALAFAVFFLAPTQAPELGHAFERVLDRFDAAVSSERVVRGTLKLALESYGMHLGGLVYARFLSRMLAAANGSSATACQLLKQLVLVFADGVTSNEHVRRGFLHAAGSVSALRTFCSTTIQGTPECQSKRELSLALCTLLLKAKLATRPDELSFDSELALGLLQAQQALQSPTPCVHLINRSSRPATPLFQERCTQSTQSASADWRSRLAAELEVEAKQRQSLLVRRMGEVCRELEERCETVEMPLLEERHRYQQLQSQYEDLHARFSGLEAQTVDRGLVLEALEAEKNELEEKLISAASESDQLVSRVEELQRVVEHNRGEAQAAIDALCSEKQDVELELRAVLASKQETLSQRDEELRELRETLSQLHRQSESLQESHIDLERKLGFYHSEAEREAALTREAKAETDTLQNEKVSLISNLELLQQKLADNGESLKEAEQRQCALKQKMQVEIESLRLENEAKTRAAMEEASYVQSVFKFEIATLTEANQELQDTVDRTLMELHEAKDTLTSVQSQVQQLKDVCDAREAELAEARTMKARMISAMGFLEHQAAAAPSARGRRAFSHQPSTPVHRRTRTADQITHFEFEEHPSQEQDMLECTSSQKERSPKRTKLRRSSRVPAIKKSLSDSQPRSSAGAMSALKRIPLTNVTDYVNRSPRRVEHDDKVVAKFDGVCPATADIDNFSFNASDMFSSTPVLTEPPDSTEGEITTEL